MRVDDDGKVPQGTYAEFGRELGVSRKLVALYASGPEITVDAWGDWPALDGAINARTRLEVLPYGAATRIAHCLGVPSNVVLKRAYRLLQRNQLTSKDHTPPWSDGRCRQSATAAPEEPDEDFMITADGPVYGNVPD